MLPMTALYEKQGTIVNTYGTQKTFAQAQPAPARSRTAWRSLPQSSAAISKTKAFKAKDIAALVKKVKAGKIGAGAFKPVKAAAAKPYGDVGDSAAHGHEPGFALRFGGDQGY